MLSFISEQAAQKNGFPIVYGDRSPPAILQTAGISSPQAVMVMHAYRKGKKGGGYPKNKACFSCSNIWLL